ncbi:chromosome alignment-maintaining phosphoprotein 1-like [Melanotaenia boesemani]|uniref:chromosome alignment-maintaining phosphoprotein 1-like n=1 Tax=Melanotaenia boesemani TaxID=1250792 RepID=UPI001C0461B9|nr:chromosome alignment-maintaining phosphoprotein 1-like [Melanotaenia boesemani]XP_041834773.1 chromosome alignment-maintaining phosphoprotein 1-like [Melanotaenia boesemani]
MSTIIQSRGEVGGGVAAHLRCPRCSHLSKSHAHQLSHIAASHPTSLDGIAMGRLGNILMYQSSGRLFHCSECFFTSRDFTKLYKHIITKHCMNEREAGGGGSGERGGEGGDDGSDKGEEEEEKEKVALKSKESIKTEEEEQGEAEQRSLLMLADGGYRCLICSWKHKQKSVIVSHVVRKHDLPKAYATQAIKREAIMAGQTQGGGAEDEEGGGMSEEMVKEEVAATAKVVGFMSNRFVCLICGWKTKLKGFVISHVVRCHDVERPYSCKECGRSFFLPSRLQQHVRVAHRPGRYACPFCYFRSEYLGGFRRHCSRCNAREEDGAEGGGVGAGGEEEDDGDEEEPEERKETRGTRKRRSSGRVIEEEDLEDEDDDD